MSRSAQIKKFSVVVFLALACTMLGPLTSQGAEIYGHVAKKGKVLSGAKVSVNCPSFSDSMKTNRKGKYRFSAKLRKEEKCRISVSGAKNSVTFIASKRRTRVNLEIAGGRLHRR